MKTAALFDLDGVLVDTEGQYTLFWQQVGERDFPGIADFATRIKGRTLTQIFDSYYPDDKAARQRVTEALNLFESQMEFPFIPGAMDFVAALRREGFKVAVVTSSNRAKMAGMFKHHPDFESFFDRVFTAEDALRSKPAPDCYLSAARRFGFEAGDCYVFEDSLSGLRAGHDSGATVIGLATTYAEADIQPLCDCVIPDFNGFTVEQMCNLKH